MRTPMILLACAAVVSTEARAQETAELSVQLVAASGIDVSGALVALLDSGGSVVTEVLSNRAGRTIMRAPPGTYRLRVRRIGYRPFFSEPVALAHSTRIDLRVESPRVVLSTMVVSARAQCGRIAPDAQALATAWEEIAKALKARQLTSADVSSIGRARVYKREVRPNGVVISADTAWLPTAGGRPFAATDNSSLVRDGYVRGNVSIGWEYFGPDEAVLLSSGFAETHCFRVVRDPRRKDELGVAFQPVPRRRMSDIEGVLWIDAATSELREIVFRYVNVEMLDRFRPGGFTRFRRMPSGAWIVSEWQLRMPKLIMRPARGYEVEAISYLEDGGTIAPAEERER